MATTLECMLARIDPSGLWRREGQPHDPGVLAQVAALKTMTMPELKAKWRDLNGSEPPGYNRRFLESRLAHRIQEVVYGGLAPETVRYLEQLGEELYGGKAGSKRVRAEPRPVRGTQFVREWQGVEHRVTVLDDGFEWQGRPYKSLSAVARAITGTRWNGPLFFGLRRAGEPKGARR